MQLQKALIGYMDAQAFFEALTVPTVNLFNDVSGTVMQFVNILKLHGGML